MAATMISTAAQREQDKVTKMRERLQASVELREYGKEAVGFVNLVGAEVMTKLGWTLTETVLVERAMAELERLAHKENDKRSKKRNTMVFAKNGNGTQEEEEEEVAA